MGGGKRPICHTEAPADLWRQGQHGVAQDDRSGFRPPVKPKRLLFTKDM